jgi:hypothetical protein
MLQSRIVVTPVRNAALNILYRRMSLVSGLALVSSRSSRQS